jgi:curved DNA-binding protein
MAKDPYEVLGLHPGATRDDINRAFRKLAKQHHPDMNPGNEAAEDKFKTITEAHNQLTGKAPMAPEILPPPATT